MTDGPRPTPDPAPEPASDFEPVTPIGSEPALPSEPELAAQIEPEPSADDETIPEPEPPIEPAPVQATGPSVESTRRLLGASFDLLTRTSEDMRRASFYIGVIVVGTIGPFALANWALLVIADHRTDREFQALLRGPGFGWYVVLELLVAFALFAAIVESRVMAAVVLGGHYIGRPVTIRQALARSRMIFWRAVGGTIIVFVPVLISQAILESIFTGVLGPDTDVSIPSSTLVAALVGAPLAYVLTGIVLGDVDPLEAVRRSFRVFRARKVAAVLVAVFETLAVLLIWFGLGAGLDIAQRAFDALGLGTDSGPAGLTLITIGLMVGVFAFGTLIYTALAISIAPQVVMFVGLTHATMGLDHVRSGGDRDPDEPRPGQRKFRWLTRPMRSWIAFSVFGLVVAVSLLSNGRS